LANRYVDLYSLMHDFVGSDEDANKIQMQDGTMMNYFPVKKISIPVDTAFVRKNGTVESKDSVSNEIRFELSKDILLKNDMAVLNIIAANKWARPIYFTSPFGELGFSQFLRTEGQAYRLIPVAGQQGKLNTRASYDIIKNKFAFGNANMKGVYFDEETEGTCLASDNPLLKRLAIWWMKEQTEKAKELLAIEQKNIKEENFPYAMVSRQNQFNTVSMQLLEAAYKAGDKKLAAKILAALRKISSNNWDIMLTKVICRLANSPKPFRISCLAKAIIYQTNKRICSLISDKH